MGRDAADGGGLPVLRDEGDGVTFDIRSRRKPPTVGSNPLMNDELRGEMERLIQAHYDDGYRDGVAAMGDWLNARDATMPLGWRVLHYVFRVYEGMRCPWYLRWLDSLALWELRRRPKVPA